ncbi:benzoate-CoA ligase family protein [Streptomyces sp. KN37]|uniref:benzoate-CoA ligase family protein n=1 Tax=Streptomyces sp. KN37 TaxID=3090667 RepID=UPI002A74CD8B|nr:benzoate-CoA ligase family protein [Streptomyces sp. KN37]WPO70541.1 benzoate-CoA ligase family protein [Streptomyces sp. KN37]
MPLARFNLSTLVDRNLDVGRGERTAFHCGDEQVTYADVFRRMCAMGRALRALGVRREERVLLALDDSPDFVTAFLGALRVGAVPVPVNPRSRIGDFRFFAEDSYAKAVVAEAGLGETLSAALGRSGVRVIEAAGAERGDAALCLPELLDAHDGELPALDTHGEDVAFWLYSSGSTGRPKGVVHLQRDAVATCRRYAGQVLGATQQDLHFSSTKLFHAYGLGNGLTFPLWHGGSAVLMRGRPTPEAVLDTVERFRPTLFFSVPTLYSAMLRTPQARRRDLSSVRLCVSAAEPLPATVWHAWHDTHGLAILDGVGSTEMLHIYCSNTPGAERPGSSGKAVPGYEIKLVDSDGRTPRGAGRGEMYVRGPSTLARYWHRQESTRACLQGDWYRTGDRYRVDEDGYHWFEGRDDDMIKIGGLWVAPTEIEDVLLDHPRVLEAAVVGVRQPDGLSRVKAFVVPLDAAPGTYPEGADDLADQLRHWCKERLQRYQFPHAVEFVGELPKTATGKVRRFELRAWGIDRTVA